MRMIINLARTSITGIPADIDSTTMTVQIYSVTEMMIELFIPDTRLFVVCNTVALTNSK